MSLEANILREIEEYNNSWDLAEDGTIHQLQHLKYWDLDRKSDDRATQEKWVRETEASIPAVKRIHKMIEQTPTAECLSSPYEYIREFKLWISQK